ncbi:hypothetical protein BKD30_07390 [Tersicoccus phoenicis]|uniref:Ribonuclease VapC n=1 Tax=Tersicoccus phoenicis TaxID=554083 RepID=A0A1R1LBD0_9MICC|nr:hypothetical protein BKD30_07390 [Tersicoccus phoenicis]
MAVVDASIITAFYASDDPRRDLVAARLTTGDALFAPAHLDAEVVSALRGMSRSHPALRAVVPAALHHLAGFPIRRMALAPLMQRMWELRDNVTPYDAAYVALAERLDACLVTSDSKLAAATGPRCDVELIA